MGKLSYVQVGLLGGWGLVDFDPSGVNLDKLNNAYLSALAADGISLSATPTKTGETKTGPFRSVDPYNNSARARANIFWVWNPNDNFSMGAWASYQYDDQGFTGLEVNTNGSISSAEASNHLVSRGIRPSAGCGGPFAIQGQAALAYLSNDLGTQGLRLRQLRRVGYLHDRPDDQTERRLLYSSRAARLRDVRLFGLIRSRERLAVTLLRQQQLWMDLWSPSGDMVVNEVTDFEAVGHVTSL